MIAMVAGIEIMYWCGEFYAQQYTDCGLPKSKDHCKHFRTLQGALMWAARQ